MQPRSRRPGPRTGAVWEYVRVPLRAFASFAPFAFLVFVLGCSRPASHGDHVRIAVGGQNQLVYLPTTLARELGFYREEGLDVELQDHQGGAKALESLLGGSADVVSGFYDHTIQMAADRRALVAFVTMLRFPGLVLTTSPQASAAVTRIEDLRGRVAGVTAVGSSSQMLLTYLLRKHDVPVESVSVIGVGAVATAIAAVERGRVDAAMMADPAFTMLSRRTSALRLLADLRSADGVQQALGTSTYPASVLYAPDDWIRGHRDTTARLARAIVRTLAWMQTHSPEEIAARMPADFRGGGDDTVYTEALRNSMAMFSPDGVMASDGAEAVHTVLAASIDKVSHATIDVSATYTNEFVRQ